MKMGIPSCIEVTESSAGGSLENDGDYVLTSRRSQEELEVGLILSISSRTRGVCHRHMLSLLSTPLIGSFARMLVTERSLGF